MEIHQLRYFIEVARQGNFSRAAEICHVAQPSLSQQLKKLEEELGQSLIYRSRRGARLTAFGERMLPRALQILSTLESVESMAREENGIKGGRVSLGAIPTVAPYLLPDFIHFLRTRYAGWQVEIVEGTTEELVEQLRTGRLDFALLSPPFEGEDEMEVAPFRDDELRVMLPVNHPLAKRKRIPLESLESYPMILLKDMHCLSRQSMTLCQASGIRPNLVLKSSQLETIVAMVEAGVGFSFLPQMAEAFFKKRNVVILPIHAKGVKRTIAIVRPRYQMLNVSQQKVLEWWLSQGGVINRE